MNSLSDIVYGTTVIIITNGFVFELSIHTNINSQTLSTGI
jgi:hypothetical protein